MALKAGNRLIIDNVISNTSVNIIQITEDRLENILTRHVDRLSRPKDLIGVFSLVLSLFGLWATTDFQSKLLPAQTWQGVFGAVLVGSIVYMLYVAWSCYKNKSSVDEIMKEIKKES